MGLFVCLGGAQGSELYIKMPELYIKMPELYIKMPELYIKMPELYIKMPELYTFQNSKLAIELRAAECGLSPWKLIERPRVIRGPLHFHIYLEESWKGRVSGSKKDLRGMGHSQTYSNIA